MTEKVAGAVKSYVAPLCDRRNASAAEGRDDRSHYESVLLATALGVRIFAGTVRRKLKLNLVSEIVGEERVYSIKARYTDCSKRTAARRAVSPWRKSMDHQTLEAEITRLQISASMNSAAVGRAGRARIVGHATVATTSNVEGTGVPVRCLLNSERPWICSGLVELRR